MDPSKAAELWEANAETWTRHARAGYDVYRDALNTPAFLAMLPPVQGLSGLDIGCGEGANTRKLAALGARMTAIDIAPTFIRHASEADASQPLGIVYRTGDGQALPFPAESFDFATAFMSLMDMPNPEKAIRKRPASCAPADFSSFPSCIPVSRRPIAGSCAMQTEKQQAWS